MVSDSLGKANTKKCQQLISAEGRWISLRATLLEQTFYRIIIIQSMSLSYELKSIGEQKMEKINICHLTNEHFQVQMCHCYLFKFDKISIYIYSLICSIINCIYIYI